MPARKPNVKCPACGAAEAESLPPDAAPEIYLCCRGCRSIFSPKLLSAPLTPDEWDALPRPDPTDRDAAALLRPLGGFCSVATAGSADLKLLEAIRNRGLPVAACDGGMKRAAEARKISLPVKCGTPSDGIFTDRHDLILVEGLLEYSPDPAEDLAAIRKALQPDGRARLEVPTASGFLARKFGARFSLFASPGVRTLFSFDGLTILAVRAGFRRISKIRKPARATRWLIASQPYGTRLQKMIAGGLERTADPPSILVAVARSD